MAHALLSAQRSYDSNPYVFLLRILHNTVVDMSTGHWVGPDETWFSTRICWICCIVTHTLEIRMSRVLEMAFELIYFILPGDSACSFPYFHGGYIHPCMLLVLFYKVILDCKSYVSLAIVQWAYSPDLQTRSLAHYNFVLNFAQLICRYLSFEVQVRRGNTCARFYARLFRRARDRAQCMHMCSRYIAI
jgi:hypothetical protein